MNSMLWTDLNKIIVGSLRKLTPCTFLGKVWAWILFTFSFVFSLSLGFLFLYILFSFSFWAGGGGRVMENENLLSSSCSMPVALCVFWTCAIKQISVEISNYLIII